MNDALVKAVELLTPDDQGERRTGYPWDLPAIEALRHRLALHHKVTYLIGENGSGEPVRLTRAFLDSRQRFLEHLFSD